MNHGDCNRKCAGGKACSCSGLVPHAHHICYHAECCCHAAEAYGLELVTEGDTRETVYVPLVRRMEVQP